MRKVEDTLKARELSDATIKAYMMRLRLLNGGRAFNSFAFLKNIPAIDTIIEKGKENTQKNYYVAITSTLKDYKDKPTYKKMYQYYLRKLETVATNLHKIDDSNEKTETQAKNWMEWDDVLKVKKDLQDKVDAIDLSGAEILRTDYDLILSNVILALYTDIEPRRNKDYMLMRVAKFPHVEELPKTHNYFDIERKRLIYNVYKTSNTYMQQIIDVKDNLSLLKTIDKYLKVHQIGKELEGNYMFPLLAHHGGSEFTLDYDITRTLNKIFDKNIGASMLRHIYNSRDKETVQKIRELKETAKNMGHSIGMALNYMKN
jgi:hypothetical protein